jgi:exodeoxyribonuclease-5
MQFSPQQDTALKAVAAWLKAPRPQLFRLFGYAGTGKTTLARYLAEGIDGRVAFAAFTGKAAHVMRQKGCAGATTIHSLIYRPRGSDDDGLNFSINRDSAAARASLIVVDECSMVDEDLGRDLLSFGTKVLVLGDPAQLPPVQGGGFFTEGEPDVMLTEVHRQAADDPIIRLSMQVRAGETLSHGAYGQSRVVTRDDIDADAILAADQVLVGTNRTRQLFNGRIRALKGFDTAMPAVSDKLVCLRNDKKKGLLNGGTWTVSALRAPRGQLLRYDIVPEDEEVGRTRVPIAVHPALFGEGADTLPPATRRRSDAFDFGYALTVHKAQGSQWDDVVLFDESYAFREHRARWLYTGITRAANRLTVVR